MAALLLDFARTNDAVAATSSRLAKQTILATYFATLDDADLKLAVRFAGGRHFSSTDERVLNVGWRVVSDVVVPLVHLDPVAFHDLIVRSGETGEALAKVWPTELATACAPPSGLLIGAACKAVARESLTLQEIAAAFDKLATTSRGETKRAIVADLFLHCCDPREAAYLAKLLFRELRSGVREGLLQAAVAEAFGKPLVEIQRCQLLIGDLDEVAVLARHDELATAKFQLFHPVQFMLATPQETAGEAAETIAEGTFLVEDKLDGIRAQVHKSADRVAIFTRTMDRIDESFPEVVELAKKLPGEVLLDGEIVPYRDGVVLPFAHIQRRLGRKALSNATLRDDPATFIAFDLLAQDGLPLLDESLSERRRRLEALSSNGLLVSEAIAVRSEPEIVAAFDAARARRNEGIVLKDSASAYSPGRRGKAWLKLKTHLPTLDCVVTTAEYGHGKRRKVLSDYTFAVWNDDETPRLVNVGKAYSGLTDAEIEELTQTFLKLAIRQRGRAYDVEPLIVLEIACDQIQKSDRHESGFAMRFPRIKRIRTDKLPVDADRLSRVRELYESSHNFARPATHAGSAAKQKPVAAEPTLFD